MNGTFFAKAQWAELYGAPVDENCGRRAFSGEGSGNGYHSYVIYDTTGDRVAVLLLNRDRVDGAAAVRRLYCGA